MPNLTSVMAELKKKGSDKGRSMYARHGMPRERTLGVGAAEMKEVAKSIKGEQALACELYDTGVMEAMYIAGMVADGAQMTRKQLDGWAANAAGLGMISEFAVPGVAIENPHARDLAKRWIQSKKEHVASTGWCTYSRLLATQPDEALDLSEIENLLSTVAKEIGGAPNRVRYTMNGFVIAVGSHVKPLLKQAKETARKIGAVSVDMGETACRVPLAIEHIEKAEKTGKVGHKRKSVRG